MMVVMMDGVARLAIIKVGSRLGSVSGSADHWQRLSRNLTGPQTYMPQPTLHKTIIQLNQRLSPLPVPDSLRQTTGGLFRLFFCQGFQGVRVMTASLLSSLLKVIDL